MERAERLRELARDINRIWFYDSDDKGVVAESVGPDDTKVRLSWDEYDEFVRVYVGRILENLTHAPNMALSDPSPLTELAGKVRQVRAPNTCVGGVIDEVMGIPGPWDPAKFPAPSPIGPDAQFICFTTPIRIPTAHVLHLAAYGDELAEYLRQTEPEITWALCRGFIRYQDGIHGVYSFHPEGRMTKIVILSEHLGGRWRTSTGALAIGFLEWMSRHLSYHTNERKMTGADSIPMVLMELDADDIDQHTVSYAEWLAEQQPAMDPFVQEWLRRRDLGQLKAPPQPPVDRHTAAVNLYLETTKILIEISQKKDVDDFYRQAAARIRLATIYEVDASLFRQLLTKSKPLVDSLMERHSGTPEQRLYEAAKGAAPIPETRPFDDMFVALSRPVRLDQYPEVTRRIFTQIRGRPTQQVWCEAVFVTRDFPLLIFQAEPPHRELLSLWTDHWEGGDTLLPWALPWLLRLLYEHDARVISQQTGRVRYQTRAKKLRVPVRTPPPYYAVTLRAHHLSPVTGGGGPRNTEIEWRHRWHVQAHERAYISRGPLPLALTDREALLRNGYQVFEGPVDERCREALERRGKSPKRYDEWLAIRYVQVSEAIKPDRPDLPLVPSTRRVRNLSV